VLTFSLNSIKDIKVNNIPEMTLRDYFAAQALPQVMKQWTTADFEGWSEIAYEMADAMMDQRNATQ
tara:strand:- start:671 stop:868 length:198 start_codon:yes stop_codon:yes gene_type:complete